MRISHFFALTMLCMVTVAIYHTFGWLGLVLYLVLLALTFTVHIAEREMDAVKRMER